MLITWGWQFLLIQVWVEIYHRICNSFLLGDGAYISLQLSEDVLNENTEFQINGENYGMDMGRGLREFRD